MSLSFAEKLISPLSIAPMIDWTDSHFRVLMRILLPSALVYTEMQTTGAVQYKPLQALYFNPLEQPVALQLGGSCPNALASAARAGEEAGFAEINLNVGCPSDRVQSGRFGACLMAEPALVAELVAAMKAAVRIPVTVKTRIGIDEQDSYAFFSEFVAVLQQAKVDKLILHARKAWLKGLSPKQNRTIPPLHYDYGYRIKAEWPELPLVLNGNIQSAAEVAVHQQHLDGVMIGRLACQNPYALVALHQQLFPEQSLVSRSEAFEAYWDYLLRLDAEQFRPSFWFKPLLTLAHGLADAKHWKAELCRLQRCRDKEAILGARELLLAFIQNF